MHSSDVRKWIHAYERSHSECQQEKSRRELDRLGLVTLDPDLESDAEWNRERTAWQDTPPARPAETATRLALLVGAAMIAALAIFFG